MSLEADSPQWLYYQLFAGSSGREDWLLDEIVAPAIADLPDATPWFFLRYFDERGPHVRLRVLLPVRDGIEFQRRFEPLVFDVLPLAAARSSAPLPRLVKVPPYLTSNGRHIGFGHAVYEPEHDKYGGPQGLARAERAFTASSEVVLRLLHEGLGDAVSRAGLCVLLMDAVAARCLPADRRAFFWSRYVEHWSGGATARGQAVRDRLGAAMRSHQEPLAERAASWGDHPVGRAAVDELGSAVADAVDDDRPDLLLHHVHLTNNRLGALPVEEALLGSVLASLSGSTLSPAHGPA